MKTLLLFLLLLASPLKAGLDFTIIPGGYVSVSSSAPDLLTNWTVAFWVQIDDTAPVIYYYWERWTNTTTARQLALYNGSVVANVVDVPYIANVQVGTAVYAANVWYPVVLTRSGNVWTLYTTNGAVDVGPTTSAITQEGGGTFVLGGKAGSSPAAGLVGTLAEMAGWSSVLSAGEITSFCKGTPPNMIRRASLAYYWPMHSISGTAVADLGGGGWNGTSSGTVTNAYHAPMSPPAGAR